MNAVEEHCDKRLFIDDDFSKELDAYIMAEDSSEKSSDSNFTRTKKVNEFVRAFWGSERITFFKKTFVNCSKWKQNTIECFLGTLQI